MDCGMACWLDDALWEGVMDEWTVHSRVDESIDGYLDSEMD